MTLREALEKVLSWPLPRGTVESQALPGWLAKEAREALDVECREEFLVVGARGYPGPQGQQTRRDAERFVAKHGGRIRHRFATEWHDLDPEPGDLVMYGGGTPPTHVSVPIRRTR